jgi:hypothetical protein
VFPSVEPDHLVTTLRHGLLLGCERRGVVSPGLDRTGAARRGARVVL